jgi:hypothetical protein
MRNFRSKKYAIEFNFFLRHTNQKRKLLKYLSKLIIEKKLETRFIDIGAGEGVVTEKLSKYFNNSVAIEPNKYLFAQIINNTKIIVLNSSIESIKILPKSDLVVFSHSTYYFKTIHFERILKLVKDSIIARGFICIVIQDYKSDFSIEKREYDDFTKCFLNSPIFKLVEEKVLMSVIKGNISSVKRISKFFSGALKKNTKTESSTKMNCNQRVFLFKKITETIKS